MPRNRSGETPLNIWLWTPDSLGVNPGAAEKLLTADECRAYDRISAPKVRDRQIFSRAGLRLALGRRLDVDPAAIRFSYGPRGKPLLDFPSRPDCNFNLSHSGELCVLAVATGPEAGGDLGVDVERAREVRHPLGLAERHFGPDERRRLLAAADTSAEFLRLWTRKEALLKLQGSGLFEDLASWEVAPTPATGGWIDTPRRAWVQDLALPAGYVGALATTAELAAEPAWL